MNSIKDELTLSFRLNFLVLNLIFTTWRYASTVYATVLSVCLCVCHTLILYQDTTSFEVNVTACDLDNSFIFDNEA